MIGDGLTDEERARRLATLQTDPDFRLRCVDIAERTGRHSISIELNPDYVTMARARVEAASHPQGIPQ